jgi:hypothetical protein
MPARIKRKERTVQTSRLEFGSGLSSHLLMFTAIFPTSETQLTILFTLAIERKAKLGD